MPVCLDQLIEWRRQFHRYPEAGWQEFVTTAKLIEYCEALGFKVLTGLDVINPEHVQGRITSEVAQSLERALACGVPQSLLDRMQGYTGCVAVWDTTREGPTSALRFDIDCVCVGESQASQHLPNQQGFASENPGWMHACGHDGHMAIGMGVAQWIADHAHELTGTIKLVFQPAEEGVRGAAAMAASGVLDDVDFFAGAHLSFCATSGQVITNPTHFLCTTKLDICFQGTPAHAGAAPHLGHNALLAAAHAVTQMHGIARHGDGMTRINVGVLQAGEGRNVVPSHARMQLEVRGQNAEINQFMVDSVLRIAQGVACSFDVAMTHEVMGSAVDLTNDAELVNTLTEIASRHPNVREVINDHPFNGSEDATILARRVQDHGGKAMYFIIGADRQAGHHQAEFDFDEAQLLTGYELYVELLKAWQQA